MLQNSASGLFTGLKIHKLDSIWVRPKIQSTRIWHALLVVAADTFSVSA